MNKNERLTLGLQDKLYRLIVIKFEKTDINFYHYNSITKSVSKHKWSRDQIYRMARLFQHIHDNGDILGNYYKCKTDPPSYIR